jgi:hypothetical protein
MMLRYHSCRPSCMRPMSVRSAGVARRVQVASSPSGAKSQELARVRNALAAGARESPPTPRWAATGSSEDCFGHGRLHNVGIPY